MVRKSVVWDFISKLVYKAVILKVFITSQGGNVIDLVGLNVSSITQRGRCRYE